MGQTRFLFRAAEWTLGSLTAIPSNLAGRSVLRFPAKDRKPLTLGSDISYKFLVSSGLSLLAALVALREDFICGRDRDRQPPYPSERERVCTVRANRARGREKGTNSRHFNYLDIVLVTNEGSVYNAEQPAPTDGEEESYNDGKVRNAPLEESGRLDDSYGVFDIWGAKEDRRSVRFDPSEFSDAEPVTAPRSPGKKTYIITFTDRYMCSPLRSTLRYVVNGEYLHHDFIDGSSMALLDRSTPPSVTEPHHNHSKFVFRAVGRTGNATNQRREFIQFGTHLDYRHKLLTILLRLRRNLPRYIYLETAKIRTFWLEYERLSPAASAWIDQHPLNRRASHVIGRNWVKHLSSGSIYRYANRYSEVYKWLSNLLAEVSAGNFPLRQNYRMLHNRTKAKGVPTQGPFIWPGGRSLKLPSIRERFVYYIRDFKEAGYPSYATDALAAHPPETNCGAPSNHEQYQFWWDGPIVFPYSDGTTTNGFVVANPPQTRRNEPDGTERASEEPPRVSASVIFPGLYELFGSAKRGAENGSPKTCSRGADAPQSLYSSHMGCTKGPSPRSHLVPGRPNNHSFTYGQPHNTLSAYTLCAPAGEPLTLGNTGRISIIQSHIYKSLFRKHSGDHDRPFALAHGSYKLFESIQTTSQARGRMGAGSAANLYGKISPKGKQWGKLELAYCCRPRIRTGVMDSAGSRLKGSPCDGNLSLSGSMMGQSLEGEELGAHSETNYERYRIDKSMGSVGGDGAAYEGSPNDPPMGKSTHTAPSPHIGGPLWGVEWFVLLLRRNVFGIYKLQRACAPQFFTTREWKYSSDAILKTLPDISLPRSNYRTKLRGWIRLICGQLLRKPALKWLVGDDSSSQYLTAGALLLILSFITRRGPDYIDLWIRLGAVRFWLYPLQKYRFGRSMPRSSSRYHPFGAQRKSFEFLAATIEHYAKNGGNYLLSGGLFNRWLYDNKGLDIYPPAKLLHIQFVATDENNSRHELGGIYNRASFNNDYGYWTTREHGPYYLRCLARNYEKDKSKHMLLHSNARTGVSSALWQRITPSDEISVIPPATPQSGFSPSKGILLMVSAWAGRSYLTNDLAADFDAPLIPISVSELYETERYLTINEAKTNGIKLSATNLCRLIILGGLTERMSPRVIWIRDMQEMGHKVEEHLVRAEIATSFSGFSLLSSLILLTGYANRSKSTLVIGSTHKPRETDPSLICSNRLDRLINARMLSTPRRQKQFPVILRSRQFDLVENNSLPWLNAFGCKTMCCYARDLASLANEVFLIETSQYSITHGNALGSVMLGQVVHEPKICLNTVTNHSDHIYRVGKAATRGTVVGFIPASPSYEESVLKYPTSDEQFSYTPEWYEPSIAGTTIGEFAALSRVLGCLAVSAVHAWVAPESRRYDSISFAGSTVYDSTLARTALAGSIVAERQWSEIHEGQFLYGDLSLASRPLARATVSLLREAAVSVPSRSPKMEVGKYEMTEDTTARTHTNDTASNTHYYRVETAASTPVGHASDPSQTNDLDYDHVLFRYFTGYARRNLSFQGTYHQPGDVLLTDRFLVSGVPISTGRDDMEYQLPDKPASFTGRRYIWDPSSPRFCQFESSNPELFMGVDKSGSKPKGAGNVGAGGGGLIISGIGTNNRLAVTIHDNLMPIEALDESAVNGPVCRSRFALWGRGRSLNTIRHPDRLGARPKFKRTHLFYPVYLYQAWPIVEPPPYMVARSELPNHQQIWPGAGPLPGDAPTHSIISEIYQYLSKGFSDNVVLLSRAIGILDYK
uniref:Hypothetical chloroplast RF2 n=1 Tax=Selaginella lepidophylla TaxID=59777 RepID=A0A3Q9R283_SELLP|nr:hypothetical chloroplast RF2 [Selaginella lepidophylla]AZU95881.1 hypothetical chloroplast RF2 [Selaginella lepidophylla]